jgi:O-Antigen ligase
VSSRAFVDVLLRAVSLVCFAGCLALLYSAAYSGAVASAGVLVLIALAAWNPYASVLVTVALSPIANYALGLTWALPGNFAETLVLATCSGVLLRRAVTGERWNVGEAAIPAVFLAVTVIASVIVQLSVIRAQLSPAGFDTALVQTAGTYQYEPSAIANLVRPAAWLLEGLLLFTIILAWQRTPGASLGILRMFVAGACGAAALNLTRVLAAALRSETPGDALLSLLRSVRFGVPFSDVNAVGSYFVLALGAAVGLAAAARGWARGGYSFAALLAAMATWTSGSRTAVLAALSTLTIPILLRPGRARAIRVGIAVCAAAAILLVSFPNPIIGRTAAIALIIRAEMARTAMRLLSLDPVFGIGIGQFYTRSAEFIRDPRVLAIYARENAHNNFLQILAELGFVGFAAFMWLLWIAGRDIFARLRAGDVSPAHTGAAVGLVAFLVTCLGGHPLLTSEVAFAFWAVLGAAATPRPLTLSRRVPQRIAAAAVVAIGLTIPYRVLHAVSETDLEHRGYGVTPWSFDQGGNRYRRMEHEATLFVPRDARSIELPYRLESDGPPVILDLSLRGYPADRLTVHDTTWHTYRFILRARSDDPRFLPLTLKAVEGNVHNVLLGKITARP